MIQQFILSNGDQVVCDVVEWPKDDSIDIVVRNCYKLIGIESETTRYYSFKPWMVLQDQEDDLMIININHVVGEANPSDIVIKNYNKALEVNKTSEEETAERIKQYMDKVKKSIDGLVQHHDSDDQGSFSNVLKFDPNKLH